MRPHGARDAETELDALGNASVPADRAEPPRTFLLIRNGGSVIAREIAAGERVLFGRAEDATVLVDHKKASRQHAVIQRVDNALFVQDLDSRNGTRVNDELVRRRLLAAGDVIRIADCEVIVAAAQSGHAAQPEPAADAPTPMPSAPSGLVVADPAMLECFQLCQKLASFDADVLILGETGVGKEVVAREIHQRSANARGPFVRVNCPSLPETLVESELFGREKGAFTGADRTRPGLVESADGGTLLLDEIGDLPLPLQAKLLSVIENRCVTRLGGTREIPVRLRILCATNRDLRAEIAAGRFREDLFHRISPYCVTIPPLRQRPSEILLLASLFAGDAARRMKAAAPLVSAEAARLLQTHRWPGNLRELRNAVQHAMLRSDSGVIRPEHLPASVTTETGSSSGTETPINERVSLLERDAIQAALNAENGNQTRAARRLGVSRRALIYKMRKYGL